MKKLLTFIFAAALFAACSDDDTKDYNYEIEWPQADFIALGSSASYEIAKGSHSGLSAEAPKGWDVALASGKVTVNAPAENDAEAETSGKITLSAGNFTTSLTVNSGIIVGFEDVPADILAVNATGDNFYTGRTDNQYTEYTDPKSDLHFTINYDWGSYDFWNGGVGFSTWNKDFEDGTDANHCTVNYVDPVTGKGGHNGSEVFAVAYFSGAPTVVEFTGDESYTLDHFWVMNTFYTSYVAENGNERAESLKETKGYLELIVTGYNGTGAKTGMAKLPLVDFREADSGGIIDEWTRVDLDALGKVSRIEFTFEGSDMSGEWLNSPAYFCFDDIAIRK